MTQTEATQDPPWAAGSESAAAEVDAGESRAARSSRTLEFGALTALVVVQLSWIVVLGYLVARALG